MSRWEAAPERGSGVAMMESLVAGEAGGHAAAAETASDTDLFNFVAVAVETDIGGAYGVAAVGIDDAEVEFAVAAGGDDFAAETDHEVATVAEGDRGLANGFKEAATNADRTFGLESAMAAG